MNIREMLEQHERDYLDPRAALACRTKGRRRKAPLCDIRTEFQRDRDKIIHSKSFRRLKHKTQVFLTPEGDHYRTRLTHTLEVSQIGRTIARALCLNEDLTEAIALGHDLGHTPFGHSGETLLNEVCPYGFRHNEQSLRVVDVLENGAGMNLTWEVRDGIVHHTGGGRPSTLEGQIIRFADRIAYINHDIDDAIRAGVIRETDLPDACRRTFGETHSSRISGMIHAVIDSSAAGDEIRMDEARYACMMQLRDFMFERVYRSPSAKGQEKKAQGVMRSLYQYFIAHPDALPDLYTGADLHRNVCDYIAGMTDTYCVSTYRELFVPNSFTVL